MLREEQWETEFKSNASVKTAISFCIKKSLPEHFTIDKEKLYAICKIIFLMLDDYIVDAAKKYGWHTAMTAAHICILIREKEKDIVRRILNEST